MQVHDAENKGAVIVNVGKPGMEIHALAIVDGIALCAGNKGLSRLPLVTSGERELWWPSAAPLGVVVRDNARAGGVFVGGRDGAHRVDARGNAVRIGDGDVGDIDALLDGSRVAYSLTDALIIATPTA